MPLKEELKALISRIRRNRERFKQTAQTYAESTQAQTIQEQAATEARKKAKEEEEVMNKLKRRDKK